MIGKTNAQAVAKSDWEAYTLLRDVFRLSMENVTDEKFTLILPKYLQNMNSQIFNSSGVTTSAKEITVKKDDETNHPVTYIGSWFYNNNSATTLNLNFDTHYVTTVGGFFSGVLEHIIGDWDFSSLTSAISYQVFGSSIKTLTIKSGTMYLDLNLSSCNQLTDESLASIINGLADLTGGTGKTLTLHATPKARLTAEQIATITAKNWTLA